MAIVIITSSAAIFFIMISAIMHSVRTSAVGREQRAAKAAAEEKQRAAMAAAEEKQRSAMAAAEEKARETERKRQEREEKKAAAHAQKVARAMELAELAERRLNAEKELALLKAQPAETQETPAVVTPSGDMRIVRVIKGNNVFKNAVVAFTGTIPGMTRAEAISAVKANGGKAYETMPANTTLLVVGNNPGNDKLGKADKMAGQIKKITPSQFDIMLKSPLSLEIDELEGLIRGDIKIA